MLDRAGRTHEASGGRWILHFGQLEEMLTFKPGDVAEDAAAHVRLFADMDEPT